MLTPKFADFGKNGDLYVIISWCDGRESTSKELRYRWILNSTRHLPNVKIILIEDKAVSKEEYNTNYYWEKGAKDSVKNKFFTNELVRFANIVLTHCEQSSH
ncbi:MAG: hypothetical protein OSJ73_10700 [Lachnospiraceae bacterium]|nr:hypothetical protein [Lachnospiraceae bacterium]